MAVLDHRLDIAALAVAEKEELRMGRVVEGQCMKVGLALLAVAVDEVLRVSR